MRKTNILKRSMAMFSALLMLVFTISTGYVYAETTDPAQTVPETVIEQVIQTVEVVQGEEIVEAVIEPAVELVIEPVAEPVIEGLSMELSSPRPPVEDPNPNSGLGIVPVDPNVDMNEEPVVYGPDKQVCEVSPNMFDGPSAGTYTETWGDLDIEITVYETEFGQKVDFEVTKNGDPAEIGGVYVKGGSEGGYLYEYDNGASSDSGLHTPKTGHSGKYAGISHLVFYYCDEVDVPDPEEDPEDQITVTKVWMIGETVIEDTEGLPEVIVDVYEVKGDNDNEDQADRFVDTLELKYENDWTDSWTPEIDTLNGDWDDEEEENKEYYVVEKAIDDLPEGYVLVETEITGECRVVELNDDAQMMNYNNDNDDEDEDEDEDEDDSYVVCEFRVTNILRETEEKLGSIHGYKFNDLDKDGLWDENEFGINEWMINLYKLDDESNLEGGIQANELDFVDDAETMDKIVDDTAKAGHYMFDELEPGVYYVFEEMESGWEQTFPNAGSVDDMIYFEELGYGWEIVIDGQSAVNYNFGNFDTPEIQKIRGAISGVKFNDVNRDGNWDQGEAGLGGVTISLYKGEYPNGTLVGTQVSASDGTFGFQVSDPGKYYLMEVIPSGYIQSAPTTGYYPLELTMEQDEYPADFTEGGAIVIIPLPDSERVTKVAFMFGNYQRPSNPPDDDDDDEDDNDDNDDNDDEDEDVPVVEIEDPVFTPPVVVELPVYEAQPEVVVELPVHDNPQTSDIAGLAQMMAMGISAAGLATLYVYKKRR